MKHKLNIGLLWMMSAAAFSQPAYQRDRMLVEALDRGLVALHQAGDSVSVSWRLLEEDPDGVRFDLYANNTVLAKDAEVTYMKFAAKTLPTGGDVTFRVKAHARKGKVLPRLQEAEFTLASDAPEGYIDIPLARPDEFYMDLYESCSYSIGDCTAADVDGDGQLEIIVKWDPSNAHDNSHNGYTGPVYVDCYEIGATQTGGKPFKWRIDLGPNIRAGAHYTQIMAYDLDGDGKAEVVMKTGDGTVDGTGKVIGDSTAFWPNDAGHILEGPEYLTLFSGETGEALCTTDYVPSRGEPGLWGDRRGNRQERYLACVAYVGNRTSGPKQDKMLPSVVMCRGYYTRATLVAWDWDGHELKQRWMFDSYEGAELETKSNGRTGVKTPGPWGDYSSQGNHSLRVADVDGDGLDEIVYGSCTIDHDGRGLYSTRLGHGDAMHLGPMLPGSNKLYVWQCHEEHGRGSTLRDAATGAILWQLPFDDDCGRCMAADIDPTSPGWEMWSLCTGGIRNYKGELLANPRGLSYNMACYWDGDTLRELLDHNVITKYNWQTQSIDRLVRFDGAQSINGTKAVPALQGDLLGDWREEVLLPSTDNEHLRLYLTPYVTSYRFPCLLQDIPYRHSLTVQNVGYNQPCDLGRPLTK